MLEKIISGGQTGADLGGLLAAKLHDLKTGGWMPHDWKTQNGARPEYAELFDMKAHKDFGYKSRTWSNIYDSDATIRVAVNFESPGERCTINGINAYKKPYVDVWIDKDNPIINSYEVEDIANWIYNNKFQILNIAGNSHKTWIGMQSYTTSLLSHIFMQLGFDQISLDKKYSQFSVKKY